MDPIGLKSLIVVGLSLLLGGVAHAQPGPAHAESLECRIANADLVLVAKLVDFGGEQQADDRQFHECTIDIEETLKQDLFDDEPDRPSRVSLPFYYSRTVLTHWQEHSIRLLVTVNEDDVSATRVLALTDDPLEILTADFQLLRDPEAVIQVAKQTVSRFPAAIRRVHTFRVAVPSKVLVGTKWESSGQLDLTVPVDERLEQRAQVGILSINYPTRAESARALRYFKSDENVARLKPLLHDPGFGYFEVASQNDGVEVRHYGAREAAFGALKAWGLKVEQPLIREEVKK